MTGSTPPTSQTPAPVRAPTWMRVALVTSLALNLAVVGIVAGLAFGAFGPRADGAMVRDLGFGPFTEALSDEDRAALRRAFIAETRAEGGFREGRRAMRADFDALLAILRAEPFDPDALAAVMARQEARNRDRLGLGQRLLTDRIAAMTPEDRRAFADRLERALTRRRRGD